SSPLHGASRDGTGGSDSRGASAGAVAFVAVATLLLGVVIGFFLGRVTEAGDTVSSAPPLTSPSSSTSRPPGDTIPQNTPVDPDAPPSTDLEPATVGSLDDPIPAGQAYVLGLYEIEIRSAERDAGDTLAAFDAINPSAPEGSQHVLIEIAVRYTDPDGFGNPSSIPFFVSDGEGRWEDTEAQCGLVPDAILDAAFLAPGEEVVGNTCFTVPTGAVTELRFGTEGVNGALYFALPE
ncbi:MAG: hypothetical protein ACSLFO_09195, partial [Acidimicrobiales bacterium]